MRGIRPWRMPSIYGCSGTAATDRRTATRLQASERDQLLARIAFFGQHQSDTRAERLELVELGVERGLIAGLDAVLERASSHADAGVQGNDRREVLGISRREFLAIGVADLAPGQHVDPRPGPVDAGAPRSLV